MTETSNCETCRHWDEEGWNDASMDGFCHKLEKPMAHSDWCEDWCTDYKEEE